MQSAAFGPVDSIHSISMQLLNTITHLQMLIETVEEPDTPESYSEENGHSFAEPSLVEQSFKSPESELEESFALADISNMDILRNMRLILKGVKKRNN
ncbi:hypothetical protein JTB14_021374 [Gonioctena quinquepunctata]|nr:hypothetical protein JTB14_021374 [Gonioctena quinquepunctata]